MGAKFIAANRGHTRASVKQSYPWATIVVRVDGGWMAFETLSDYQTWKGQK